MGKSLLSSTGWHIYNLFRDNALEGIQVRYSQEELSEMFNITTRQVRNLTNQIIVKTDLALIGDDFGYRVAMNEEEHAKYQNLLFARIKTSLDKYMSSSNGNASRVHKYLNDNSHRFNTKAVSGQQRAEITKDTHGEVRKYIEDYKVL